MAAIDTSMLGDPSAFKVERDGDRDLTFEGWRIGEGESGSGGTSGCKCDWNRGVRVRIYVTTGGNFVLSRVFWSRWQGENGSAAGEIYKSADALLAGIRTEEGAIRPAEKEALEAACSKLPALEGLEVESID